MNYPLAKTLALLEISKMADPVQSAAAYESLLGELLAYEQHAAEWQQTSHTELFAEPVSDNHALRSANGTTVLGVGQSLFFSINHPDGYQIDVTLYRPLNLTHLQIRGSALLTPADQQTAWAGTAVLFYQEAILIDTATLDPYGDFELTPLNFGAGSYHLVFRVNTGENITLDTFTLS